MKQCRLLETCEFYCGAFRSHQMGEFLLNDYCFGTPEFCAIYIVQKYLGGDSGVPDGLLPHELNKVKHLL